MTTENRHPEPDPNRDRSRPPWPELPAAAPGVAPVAASGPWARRLATVAAAAVLSWGGGAVPGAAAVRARADRQPPVVV